MNFKKHFELYKALIEGKTIIYKNGALVRVENSELLISYDKGESWKSRVWEFNDQEGWKIYEKPEIWYRVTFYHRKNERPSTFDILYRSKDDFLSDVSGDESDYLWIHLEEFKRG